MNENFIILELFQQQISCCCPKQKHQHMIEFRQGDVWTITNERKYVDCLGWHILMTVNREFQFLIHVEDLEELYNKGKICSIMDLDLKMIHLNFKINEALDSHDKESFNLFANELSEIQKIKNEMHYSVNVQAF
ncbi:hypothetical protein [Psychrobacillus sp.]|uniref:hypothetical protein n=1 Tax=Psychrobacillus sp. TaxID=1871623 RepID=UPI0028BF29C6|nr:hypothetical protein [Psychrobacillus sp.]